MEEYAQQHPEMRRAVWRKHAYGISIADCEALHLQQGGACGICGEPGTVYSLNVDHDHVTGRVRGLLCGLCNRALGQFRDRLDLIIKAKLYMERWEMEQHLRPVGKLRHRPRFKTNRGAA